MHKLPLSTREVLFLSAIILLSLFFFYPVLKYYFFQDDWFVLNWVRTGSFTSFFQFRQDIIYWRPLSMPLLFYAEKSMFGLNPLPYHSVSFGFFSALLVSIYFLFRKLFGQKLAFVGVFLYSIWPIHFMSLGWLSTTSYIMVTLFSVLSLYFFVCFSETRKLKDYALFLILFVLALLSHEFGLVIPLVAISYGFLMKKQIYLKQLILPAVIITVYLLMRFMIFPIPAKGDYTIYFNRLIINNLLWYLAWSVNFPESFKTIIYESRPLQSIKTLTEFWRVTMPAIALFIVSIRLLASAIKLNFKNFIFGCSLFVIGILPVLNLVNHSYAVYLSIAGLGFIYLLILGLKNLQEIWLIALILIWAISSWSTLNFNKNNHWITNEQAISRIYVSYTKNLIKNSPDDSVFFFRHPTKEYARQNNFTLTVGGNTLSQSLNKDDAMQVVYNNSTLKSIYLENERPIILPNNIIYDITPR